MTAFNEIEDSARRLAQEMAHPLYKGAVYATARIAMERGLFHEVLRQCEGSKARAARQLGINRNTLDAKLKRPAMAPSAADRTG